MKKFLYFFLILSLFMLPASAGTLNLLDTSDSVDVVVTDTNSFNSYSVLSEYYDIDDYDTFVCAEDDTFTQINFNFKNIQGDFQLPITFWYEDDTSKNMTVFVDSTEVTSNLFWTYTITTVNITDDSSNILLSGISNDFIFGEHIILSLDPQTMSLSDNSHGWFGQSVNSSVFPVRALTFDMTELNSTVVNPECRFTYTDAELVTDLDGFFGWLYLGIAPFDDSRTLYHTFLFVSGMWSLVTFSTSFLLTSTWSYLILGQAFALFYGIMQKDKGVMGMIEGYCKGTYWTLLLPINFFKFLANFFVRLVQAIGSLIPFT